VATYAIGDIHGERAALDDLLTQILPLLRETDELVFLGDYLDRGPDTKGVLDRLVTLDARARTTFLLGNHEEWFLEALREHGGTSWLLGMEGLTTVASYAPSVADSLRAELRALGPRLLTKEATLSLDAFFERVPAAHLDFLATRLVPFHRTADVLCVHGGLAAKPPEEEAVRTLVWGPPSFPGSYDGAALVVYGHHADPVLEGGRPRPRVLAARQGGASFGIDTIAHGALTAMRFPDRVIFQSARSGCDDAGP
jgi:serine/threonine protein phosphatase 1